MSESGEILFVQGLFVISTWNFRQFCESTKRGGKTVEESGNFLGPLSLKETFRP